MNVYLHHFLPVEETTKASNIETREEVSVLTGRRINALKIGQDLFVSREIWNVLKKGAVTINDIPFRR